MDLVQSLTPKPSSEVDTEHEEELAGGMAGPSSAQNQRRRSVPALLEGSFSNKHYLYSHYSFNYQLDSIDQEAEVWWWIGWIQLEYGWAVDTTPSPGDQKPIFHKL